MQPSMVIQASIILCLSQARINWEGCGRKGIRRKKNGERVGGIDGADGVASKWTVSMSASVIFPCTIKSKDGEQ